MFSLYSHGILVWFLQDVEHQPGGFLPVVDVGGASVEWTAPGVGLRILVRHIHSLQKPSVRRRSVRKRDAWKCRCVCQFSDPLIID